MKPTGTKTKLFTAYTDKKPTYKKRKQSGVYFIYDTEKNLQYVGFSGSNLYSALYRHFQEWKDRKQQRFTYPRNYLVRIILTTEKRAHLLEKFLILKLKPKDNLQKYENYLTEKEVKEVKTISENLTPVTPEEEFNIF